MPSPYEGLPKDKWSAKTDELVAALPVTKGELVDVVLSSWEQILSSGFGDKAYKIGEHIFPTPQVMGALLHAIIPLELASRKPGQWRVDQSKNEKDLVCIGDPKLCIEIKTSSHKDRIAGNRSYSQKQEEKPISTKPTKEKSGYYLTVNFEKFAIDPKTKVPNRPKVVQVAIGWIDHDDWKGQAAATGQSASISPDVYAHKLKKIYLNGKKL